MIILNERKLPHPQCPWCDMLAPWRALNRRLLTTAKCDNGSERKCQRMAEEEIQESVERDFQAYGRPLETVTLFKYLGLVLTTGDNDWPALVGKLKRAWKSWAQLKRILGWEGGKPRVSVMFFKAVVQAVLIFRSKTWVLTPALDGPWEVFNTGLRG